MFLGGILDKGAAILLVSMFASKPESMFLGGILDKGAKDLAGMLLRGGRSERGDLPTFPSGGKSERKESLTFCFSLLFVILILGILLFFLLPSPSKSKELSFSTISGVKLPEFSECSLTLSLSFFFPNSTEKSSE